MNRDWWKCYLGEGIATFALTFVAAGAVCANQYSGGELGLVGIAWAQGAILAAMIYAIGPLSGGHVNPAVTIAVASRGGIPARHAAGYIVAQLTGASIAGLLLAALYGPEVWEPVALGTPQPSVEVAFSTAVVIEALLTSFLVFTVLRVASNGAAPDIVSGLSIGLVLIAGVLVGGPLTGAAMNPARAFGPALASGVWNAQLIYWIGPIVGGIAAAWAHRILQPVEGN